MWWWHVPFLPVLCKVAVDSLLSPPWLGQHFCPTNLVPFLYSGGQLEWEVSHNASGRMPWLRRVQGCATSDGKCPGSTPHPRHAPYFSCSLEHML